MLYNILARKVLYTAKILSVWLGNYCPLHVQKGMHVTALGGPLATSYDTMTILYIHIAY